MNTNKQHPDQENPLETLSIRKAGTLLVVLVIFSIIFISGMMYASDGARISLYDGGGESDRPSQPNPSDPDDGGDLPNQPPFEGPETIKASDSDVFSVRKNDATKGNGDILLIEYSDFECSFCKRFHPVVQALVDRGDVTWIYRHMPLPFHETADEAAKIADCARIHKGDDGFWQVTDGIFDGDPAASGDPIAAYRQIALSAGLNDSQIDECLLPNSESSKVIDQHQADAQAFGVNGTPGSFLVNTKTGRVERIPGAFPLDDPTGGPSVSSILSTVRE